MTKIIRKKEVCDLTGLSRSTIYQMMGMGLFPRQVKLGIRSVGWRVEEVQAWIAARPSAPGGEI